MVPRTLDGLLVSSLIKDQLRKAVQKAGSTVCRTPHLAVVIVDGHPQSEIYVRAKQRAALTCGVRFSVARLPEGCTSSDILSQISRLNADVDIDGIIAQLPLPRSMNPFLVLNSISPEKDVDGLNAVNIGTFTIVPEAPFCPCTALGVKILLDQYNIPIRGQTAVVIGRGMVAGRPIATALEHCDATVIHCHRHTPMLHTLTRQADIIVSAAGSPALITAEHVKRGVAAIDVGVSIVNGKIAGDFAPEVALLSSAISPVPGGVGPMTVCGLLLNTFAAFARRSGLPPDDFIQPFHSTRPGRPFHKLLHT